MYAPKAPPDESELLHVAFINDEFVLKTESGYRPAYIVYNNNNNNDNNLN